MRNHEVKKMVDHSTRARELTRYEELLELRDKERRRIAGSSVCVKGKELPWEVNPQGRMKWYMHPNIDATTHKFLIFYAQEIPPGSRSGKQQYQGGVVFVVVEGAGYTVLDGERYDWKKGDLLQLPIRPDGVTFQHFNSSDKQPALLIAAEPNLTATTGVDRACGFEQLETAPGPVSEFATKKP
jgi:mannose-6-phosphate isomerase-like protein (cupin superfamily)